VDTQYNILTGTTASGAPAHPAPARKRHKPARHRPPAEHVETTLAPVEFAQPVRIVVLGLVKDASAVFGQRLEDTVRLFPRLPTWPRTPEARMCMQAGPVWQLLVLQRHRYGALAWEGSDRPRHTRARPRTCTEGCGVGVGPRLHVWGLGPHLGPPPPLSDHGCCGLRGPHCTARTSGMSPSLIPRTILAKRFSGWKSWPCRSPSF